MFHVETQEGVEMGEIVWVKTGEFEGRFASFMTRGIKH
jgi:hypothetical protein